MTDPDGRGGCVLVADDDMDFADSTKDLLVAAGYSVCVAHDGRQAVDRVGQGGVDALVLDIRMPVLSGLYVCLELKATGKSVPTIVVTGYAGEETGALRLLRSMPDTQIMFKPFDPRELIKAIGEIIDGGNGSGGPCAE